MSASPLASLAAEFDRQKIDEELQFLVDPAGLPPSPFREAMKYGVLGGGQRLRPILALRIARIAGCEGALTLRAAAAVELIHCASLIVDDLPCMDDELERRGRPAVHRVYGEATALLSAFGLVSLAARSVVEVQCSPSELSHLIRFQIQLLKILDASGLCEGQDLDLRLSGASRETERHRVNELKTVPLFDLAAQAGLMFLDPGAFESRSLRKFAQEYGRAYQMADDYLDGEIADCSVIEEQLTKASRCIDAFRPAGGELQAMLEYIHERCIENQRKTNLRHR